MTVQQPMSHREVPDSLPVHGLALASGEHAVQGETACIDLATNLVVASKAATGLFPIGTFMETLTGDGSTRVSVYLYESIVGHWFHRHRAALLAWRPSVQRDPRAAAGSAIEAAAKVAAWRASAAPPWAVAVLGTVKQAR